MSGFDALIESAARPRGRAAWAAMIERQDHILDSLRAMCMRRREMAGRLTALIDKPQNLQLAPEPAVAAMAGL